ncbi:MAG: UbiA family prenyltransferase [bacterium]
MLRTAAALVELARPLNVAIAASAILLGARFAFGRADGAAAFDASLALLPAALSLLAAGYAWNDVEDAARDATSHARRPIPSGRVSPRAARFFAILLFACGIALVFAPRVGPAARALLFAWAVLLLTYRRIADRAPALKGVVASALTASALLLGASTGPSPRAALFPALFAFLLTWLRELVKDLADRDGDRAVGRPTWADALVPARTRAILRAAAGALLVLIPLPAVFLGYGSLYLAMAAAGVGVTLLLLCIGAPRLVPDRGDADPATLARASRLLKVSMVAGLFALYLGGNTR